MGEWISIPQTCVTLNNRQKEVKRLLDFGLPCGRIARMLHVAYDVVLDDVYIIHSAEFRNGGEKNGRNKKEPDQLERGSRGRNVRSGCEW